MAKTCFEIRAYGMIDGTDNAFAVLDAAGNTLLSVDSTGIHSLLGSALSKTLTSQTTEGDLSTIDFTTDSTFLTGTNITYSSARGSAALKLTGTWSAVTGGYSNIYSLVTASGALNDANGGPIGIKAVVQANGALTAAAGIYGAQFIAKHNHATNKAANAAPFIGVEGVVTQNTAGQIGTGIGVSAAFHIPADAAVFDGGAVFRGLQVACDNSSSNKASEESGVCIWNLAGTQDNMIIGVNSGSGFTNFANLPDDGAPAASTCSSVSAIGTKGYIKVKIGAATRYIGLSETMT